MSDEMKSREEFEDFRVGAASRMHSDSELKADAFNLMQRADKYHAYHQLNWLGEPILQSSEDMFVIQEIIFNTRPDYIIECGVCWGGSLLFYSSLMKMYGGAGVIGIDIYVPDDLSVRLQKVSEEFALDVRLISGSSVCENTISEVQDIVGSGRCMIILDSNHTHEHVLKELNLYERFVGNGCYIVVSDTAIEDISEEAFDELGHELSPRNRDRPWSKGNNPRTAAQEFLAERNDFEVDEAYRNKLLMSCNPDGYLKRIG